MIKQYIQIKEKYKDSILFFRLGDFYEMFFEDAEIASKELGIVLTGRDAGTKERVPMAGIPYHTAETYIAKLVNKGYKVAICEQMEDPALAKGIVKREVIRVITPGTVFNTNIIEDKKNNFLMCIYYRTNGTGIAFVDVSTGEFYTTQITEDMENKILDEMERVKPSELIVNEELIKNQKITEFLKSRYNVRIESLHRGLFLYENALNKIKRHFNIVSLDCFDISDKYFSISCCGALLEYLEETQKIKLIHINKITYYSTFDYLMLDHNTRRNLELTETIRHRSRRGTLLWVLDKTVTAMGGRLLRKWIEQPLTDIDEIQKRLDAVEELYKNESLRRTLRELLDNVYDIERLISKLIYNAANAKDLLSLKTSLMFLPDIKSCISATSSELLRNLFENFDVLKDVYDLLEISINEDPPSTLKEGNIIKKGYNHEVDRLREINDNAQNIIIKMENEEREKTGIKSLKIGYNKVFGYYIEVTNSNLSLVPDNYIRKQTLSNCERFITSELKELEELIVNSKEKLVELEYKIFLEIRQFISEQIYRLKHTAETIAILDVLSNLAEVAKTNNYIRPRLNNKGYIVIENGRHPVVELMMESSEFIPNDTYLDNHENSLLIITGPNMAGKSTYMRQTALIVLMAQMGSFVPASLADISIVDKIFTRIGASDDLAGGQSTFMVEMSELANILNNATQKSLIILDEIGRGTSTYDGLSIAWAVLEYLSNKIRAKTLFATHYHELTQLEGKIFGIKNYYVSIKESGENIIFLRKIKRGYIDKSYGIQVAKLAGIPQEIIEKAREILYILENSNDNIYMKELEIENKTHEDIKAKQVDIFELKKEEIIKEIRSLDLISITPLQALNKLYEIQQKIIGLDI